MNIKATKLTSVHRYFQSFFSLIIVAAVLCCATPLQAQDDCIPPKPEPYQYVNDYAGILAEGEKITLEQDLRAFSDTTSNQIVVVTVTSLCGMDKAMFATEIGEKWGVGRKEFDNGVVVVVKPKEIDGKGEVFIAVGYGLEPVLTDALTKRIVEHEMIPEFKQRDYFMGIQQGVRVIERIAAGEISTKEYLEKTKKSSPVAVLFFLVIFFFVFYLIGRASNASKYAKTKGMSFWQAMFLANLMSSMGHRHRSAHRSFWDDFSSGGGGFGGFSGGDFGGGSFGGGGAGGSW